MRLETVAKPLNVARVTAKAQGQMRSEEELGFSIWPSTHTPRTPSQGVLRAKREIMTALAGQLDEVVQSLGATPHHQRAAEELRAELNRRARSTL